jgi:hypothetical protein
MNTYYLPMILLLPVLVLSGALGAAEQDDPQAIQECLKKWGKHPFKGENPPYKELGGGVKVLGIGKSVADTEVTSAPRLVLVNPAVSVLTKNTYRLLNPNGWYRLKDNVTVLGKSVIEAHCNAHLTASSKSVTVLGSSRQGAEGVTVLGKAIVTRVGCK